MNLSLLKIKPTRMRWKGTEKQGGRGRGLGSNSNDNGQPDTGSKMTPKGQDVPDAEEQAWGAGAGAFQVTQGGAQGFQASNLKEVERRAEGNDGAERAQQVLRNFCKFFIQGPSSK